jgi:ABC-type Fe3+ transport system substrate-binding protein
MEQEFLVDYFAKDSETTYTISYFGLGMPVKLKDQIMSDLKGNNDVDADVIVSTELDIFWDRRILMERNLFTPLENKLPVADFWKNLAIRDEKQYLSVPQLLPELIVLNEKSLGDLVAPESLLDLTKPLYRGKIVLGGPDTAAGRIIVMCLWYLYGEETVIKFLENVKFVSVPAMALGLLKSGVYPIGILPAVLCGRELKTIFPKEGIPVIPTYCCVNKKANYKTAEAFLKNLFGSKMQDFYVHRGYGLSGNVDVNFDEQFYPDGLPKILYPSWDFFQSVPMEKYYALMDNIKL